MNKVNILDKESNEYLEKLRKKLELIPDSDKIRCTNKIIRPYEYDELFFKHCFCYKCGMKYKFCECKISQPIVMLAQFREIMKEVKI
jgi:hypothetical protein